MKRIWAAYPNYVGKYEVSDDGLVKSVERLARNGSSERGRLVCERLRRQHDDKDGYKRVVLYSEGRSKNIGVHRMVAEAFIPNPKNYPMVNHKNGIKHDNRVENLEWCDAVFNMQHAVKSGLKKPSPNTKPGGVSTSYKGPVIATHIATGLKTEIIGSHDAIKKGFTPESICRCLSGKQKTHREHTFIRIPKRVNQ